jgi:hypothetical protein
MALAVFSSASAARTALPSASPFSNRTDYAFKQPRDVCQHAQFCGELRDDWSLSDYSERISEQWLELLRRAGSPSSTFSVWGGKRAGARRMFKIALSYQDSRILESRDAAVLLSGAGITAVIRRSSSAST